VRTGVLSGQEPKSPDGDAFDLRTYQLRWRVS
jgi:hypothetical protein